jgi:hypothetical protein
MCTIGRVRIHFTCDAFLLTELECISLVTLFHWQQSYIHRMHFTCDAFSLAELHRMHFTCDAFLKPQSIGALHKRRRGGFFRCYGCLSKSEMLSDKMSKFKLLVHMYGWNRHFMSLCIICTI